jgi:hypothetical protein
MPPKKDKTSWYFYCSQCYWRVMPKEAVRSIGSTAQPSIDVNQGPGDEKWTPCWE